MANLAISIKWDKQEIEKMRRLGGELPAAIETAVRRTLVEVSNNIKRNIGGGGVLKQRSGSLARSWTPLSGALVHVQKRSTGASGSIGSSLVYARIQEEGGIVRAKNAKNLAIPLAPAQTAAGVTRQSSPRDIPGLFLIRSRAGNLLLVKKTGAGQIEPWYVLKPQVTIQASRYVSKAVATTQTKVQSIFSAAIGEAFKKAGFRG